MLRCFQFFICRPRSTEILCIHHSEILGVCASGCGPDCEQTGRGTTTKNLRDLYLQEFWFTRSSTCCTSAVSCRFRVKRITGLAPQTSTRDEMRYAPFSDRTAWFLTSSRVVVGGTASISAWFSLMVFEAYRGKIKVVAAAAAILSVFSVLATSSRSDIAGLAVAAIVFALCAPPRRWKAYVCAAIVAAGLYAAYLTFFLGPEERNHGDNSNERALESGTACRRRLCRSVFRQSELVKLPSRASQGTPDWGWSGQLSLVSGSEDNL